MIALAFTEAFMRAAEGMAALLGASGPVLAVAYVVYLVLRRYL